MANSVYVAFLFTVLCYIYQMSLSLSLSLSLSFLTAIFQVNLG